MFQKTHVSLRNKWNKFSWMEQCRKSVFIFVVVFHFLSFWNLMESDVEIKFHFDCRCKSFQWMNETPTQHNDMHTNLKENHRKCNERWNRVARLFLWLLLLLTKWYFVQTIALQSIFLFAFNKFAVMLLYRCCFPLPSASFSIVLVFF